MAGPTEPDELKEAHASPYSLYTYVGSGRPIVSLLIAEKRT